MTAERMKVLAIMLCAVLAVSIGEAMLSRGMKQSNALAGGWWPQARGIVTNGHVLLGVLFMAVFFGLYMLALKRADLSFVLPLTALSYLFGALLAKLYLGEAVTPVRWVGALVITLGVVIVGLGDAGPLLHKLHKP
ncbi:MAG TPA: DMT family transporter [Chthonomonadaceae bacterium]|nr:DMT family transporter [Chthonomonadaceae bacterium]